MRTFVMFDNSDRFTYADDVSHETVDGTRTLCGRAVANGSTFTPDDETTDPDCKTCRRVLGKLNKANGKTN